MTTYHWIALCLFGTFALLDLLFHARTFPKVVFWRLKGIVFALLYFAVATFAPLLWDGLLGQYQLIDGSALPTYLKIAIGFLVLQFCIYWWHRALHGSDTLWRFFHQTHHSAERVDIWGAFYFHPLDMIGWALIGSIALVLGIGLSPDAVFVIVVLATFCSMFQHANLKTPYWLGFIVTRPESHSVHHERGIHGFNYGDIPLFDMIFGTFRNPKTWNGKAGFYEGSSRKMTQLLLGRKIA